MERMLLATGSLSDTATITGPTGAGDLPIDNLKTQSLQEIYRVIGTAAVINVDVGAASAINVVALMGHSGLATATVRVTAGAASGGTDYDSGTLPLVTGTKVFPKGLFLLHLPAKPAYRYWRLEISNPDGAYIDMGRLYLANAFQPSYNMVYGFAQGFLDGSQEYETISGDSVSLKRKKRRYAEFTLEDLTESEVFASVLPLDALVGTTGDVLFVPNPADNSRLQFSAIYGKIEAMNPNANTSFDRFSRQYRIKELLPA